MSRYGAMYGPFLGVPACDLNDADMTSLSALCTATGSRCGRPNPTDKPDPADKPDPTDEPDRTDDIPPF